MSNGSPKDFRFGFVGVIVIVISIFAACTDRKRVTPQTTADYRFEGITNVSKLVQQLVSPVPAKLPSGEWDTSDLPLEERLNGFTRPQVAAARARLVEMGTRIYPELAKHVKDDRYSYSIIVAAWLNESVGDAVVDIMAEGIKFSGYGYKWRKNKTTGNSEPSFEIMVAEIGWEKYADYASTRSKADLQKEFVRWKLNKERAFGFTDAEQEKEITEPYLKWINEH